MPGARPTHLLFRLVAAGLLPAMTACSSSSGSGDEGAACPESTDGLPADVFCTGLYEHRDSNQIAATALPYTPGVTFWSDGAEKQRYLYLPDASQIDTSDPDAWRFPVGTKAWKEFRRGGALVETRLFWKRDASTWSSGTYIWDATGSAAPLNSSRKPVLLADGYEIPTARDCGKCHHGGADDLLGVEAVSLALPTARGVTLSTLAAEGSLSAPPRDTSIELPEDVTGKAAAALGYLHVNCGVPCHSSRGLGEETKLLLRLRADQFWTAEGGDRLVPSVETSDGYAATVNKDASTASVVHAFPDAHRITPGDHEASLLWLLSHRRGKYQMPPLVSHAVDEEGTQALAAWIDALP